MLRILFLSCLLVACGGLVENGASEPESQPAGGAAGKAGGLATNGGNGGVVAGQSGSSGQPSDGAVGKAGGPATNGGNGGVVAGQSGSSGQGAQAASAGSTGQAGSGGSAGSAGMPMMDTPLQASCRNLFLRLQSFRSFCEKTHEPVDLAPLYIESCVSLAALPGTAITPTLLDQCAAELDPAPENCISPPDCMGWWWELTLSTEPGTLPDGQPCFLSNQCASQECLRSASHCGFCGRIQQEGEACNDTFLWCDRWLDCQKGVCQKGIGYHVGDPCVFDEDCKEHLYCQFEGKDTGGTCELRLSLGQPCVEGYKECEQSLECSQDVCVPLLPDGESCPGKYNCQHECYQGVCRKRNYNALLGAECGFDYCAPGLSCSDDHVCQPTVYRGEGEPCDGPNLDKCADGLLCPMNYLTPGGAKVCTKAPLAGEPCLDNWCAGGLRCSGFDYQKKKTGTCVVPGGIGEKCDGETSGGFSDGSYWSSGSCHRYLVCLQGTCQGWGAVSCL